MGGSSAVEVFVGAVELAILPSSMVLLVPSPCDGIAVELNLLRSGRTVTEPGLDVSPAGLPEETSKEPLAVVLIVPTVVAWPGNRVVGVLVSVATVGLIGMEEAELGQPAIKLGPAMQSRGLALGTISGLPGVLVEDSAAEVVLSGKSGSGGAVSTSSSASGRRVETAPIIG
jgi:hypothetical protein